jgi:RNA polymerase sigma factor (sigma-70 family)
LPARRYFVFWYYLFNLDQNLQKITQNQVSEATEIIITEEEIIKMMRARDQKVVRYLYDNYSVALLGIIFRIVKNNEIAEELLQETYVKAWNNFASYDTTKGRLYTWMLNIARNLAIDKVRSNEYKLSSQTQNIEKSVHGVNREYQAGFDPVTIDVKDLVNRLRPEQKELIDLIYFFGYTQAEAAEKLKMPLGTVKTRVRNAIGELRKYFK